MERRLTAIFAADMVGYSRLMEADETGTLTRQKRHRAELIDPTIERHHGRIVKLTGDGMIAEFPSVVEAVQCAVLIQNEMADREADVPEVRRIRYRIAINLGDVIFDEGDVYGDGVNIAARLEALADPGGVVVSGTAFDHLKSNIEVGYEDLGEQQVKNIATPVRVYRVVRDGQATTAMRSPASIAVRRNRFPRWRSAIGVVAVVLLMAIGIAIWELVIRPGPADAIVFDEKAVLALPTGPKLAVMPFEDTSPAEDGTLIAKGLTEEIATALSRNRRLGVVSPSSTRRLVKAGLPIDQVGEKLSVDYLIDGTVLRSGEKLRISARLFSMEKGTYVWSQTFDGAALPINVFETISYVSRSVAKKVGDPWMGEISKYIRGSSSSKPSEDLSSIECIFSYESYQFLFEEKEKRFFDCLKKVIGSDPNNVDALVHLGHIYWRAYNSKENGFTKHEYSFIDASSEEIVDIAMSHYLRAVEGDPTHPRARYGMAMGYMLKGDRASFVLEIKNALALGLSDNTAGWLGFWIAQAGEWELGLAVIERSKTIDPTSAPKLWDLPRAFKHYLDGEYLRAEKVALDARLPGAGSWFSNSILAYVYGTRGDIDLAKEAVARVREIRPDMTIALMAKRYRFYLFSEDYIEKMVDGLRAAGLPEVRDDG